MNSLEKTIEGILATFALNYRDKFPLTSPAMTKALAALWAQQLRHFTAAVVGAAASEVMRDVRDRGPNVGDMEAACWRLAAPIYPTPGEAWGQVMHELRRGVSEYGTPAITLDLADEIVTEWGWRAFVEAFRLGGKELSILQERFQREYAARVERFNRSLSQTSHVWDLAEDVPLLPQPTEPARPPAEPPSYLVDTSPRDIGWYEKLKAHILALPVLKAQMETARDGLLDLHVALRLAETSKDTALIAEAQDAIRRYVSRDAYRRFQVEALDAAHPGASELLLSWPAECRVCHDQRVVLVRHGQTPPTHAMKLEQKPDAPPNTYGRLYHCWQCVTPTRHERHNHAEVA